jgi:transposase
MPRGIYERKPFTPEHRAALSKAKLGVPLPPETCAAISATLTDVSHTPERIAAISKGCDKMRGGNDICDHHYIYDHNDLSLNTVQMTRSDHQKLHRLLQKLGYKVLHINQ